MQVTERLPEYQQPQRRLHHANPTGVAQDQDSQRQTDWAERDLALILTALRPTPQVTDGRVALQVVDVTGLGLLLPSEMVQSVLDAFTTHLTGSYPLGIHADGVQITYDGVTVHFSTRDTSIPQGNRGNQGNKDNQDPCFANL